MSQIGVKTVDASNSPLFIRAQIKAYINENPNNKNMNNESILQKIKKSKTPKAQQNKLMNTENPVGKVNTSAMSSLLVAPKTNNANKYSRFKKKLRVGIPEQYVLQQYRESNPNNKNSNENILKKIRNNTSINTSPPLPECIQAFNGKQKHYNGSNCTIEVQNNSVNNIKTNTENHLKGIPLKFPKKLITLLQKFYDSNKGKIEKISVSSFFGKKKGDNLILLLEAYNNAIDNEDNVGYLTAKSNIIIKINHIESKALSTNKVIRSSKNLYQQIGTLNNLLLYMDILKYGSKYVLGRKEITKEQIQKLLPNFSILNSGSSGNNFKIRNNNIN